MRKNLSICFFYFAIALLLHCLLFLAKNPHGLNIGTDSLEQENFLVYTNALESGSFPNTLTYADNRLLPGLPILIFLLNPVIHNLPFSGLIISALCLFIIFFVTYRLTKNPIFSLWITLFPPIIFEQTSKISTETLIIALFMLIYLCFHKRKYFLASLLSGYATIVRPVSLCIFLGLLAFLLKEKKEKLAIKSSLIYLIFPGLLFIFNFSFFTKSWLAIFYQLDVYHTIYSFNLGPLQIFLDIFRAIDWKQWRILISGISYSLFSFFLFFKIMKNKGAFLLKNDEVFIKTWSILTMVFVFSIVPAPFLEELRRYLAVFFPLGLLAGYKYVYKHKRIFYASFLLTVFAYL